MMANRKDLVSTIEQQQNQLTKYETKLKDVVRAYKGLSKENEALQSTLAALGEVNESTAAAASAGAAQPQSVTEKSTESRSQENLKERNDSSTSSTKEDPSSTDVSENEGNINTPQNIELKSLNNKVSTLTSAINTLTTEKNRIEASFQSDKKRILGEKEKLEQKVDDEMQQRKKAETLLDEKTREMRGRIIGLQHEREQDTSNSAAMLREMESHLAVERNGRLKIETLLEEAREQNRQLTVAITARSHEQHQKQITDLQNELEQVRCRLRRAEEQSEKPPMLEKLQVQMEHMSSQHTSSLQLEQVRALHAEESVRELSQTHEERVATLESRLEELSFSVANYDRARQTHIDIIQSLKERVGELSQENSTLVAKMGQWSDSSTDSDQDVNTIIHRLTRLWDKLQAANVKAEKPVDLEGILVGRQSLHTQCQMDYDQLKLEYENYKLEAARHRQLNESDAENCSCGLKSQVDDLRIKLRSLSAASQITQDAHTHQVNTLRQEIINERSASDERLREIDIEQRTSVANLDQQLSAHRQRSLSTLQDRDEEIHRLTKELHEMSKLPTQPSSVAAALLSQVGAGGSDGPLLHHLEELARKELEITQLRREKRQLEKTMREVQLAALTRQMAQHDMIEVLEMEVERRKRNLSREGENFEYLKNVVLQYMTSSDADCRLLMLKAISAVLKFTDKEMESVRKYNALWWWQASPRNKLSSSSPYPLAQV